MVRNKSSKRVCLQESSAVAFRLGRLAADRTLLLPLLRHLDDAVSYHDNPSLRASVAGVATANATTPDPPADAMGTRPGCA
jgi:hypothetical protein